jgi:GNAT superfamily N-acetyltransferase
MPAFRHGGLAFNRPKKMWNRHNDGEFQMTQPNFAAHFRVRTFRADTDVPALVRLRQQLGQNVTEAAQLDELSAPNQIPDQDRWVAVALDQPDQFLGHGFGFHTIPERYLAWLEVQPDWRRKGIGRALLSSINARAHQVGAEHILINPDSRNEAAHALLRQHGFQAVSHVWFMSAPATLSVAEPVWPPGYTVRSFADVQDYQVLQEAYFRSCADLWGNGANSKQHASTKQPTHADWSDWLPDNDPTGAGIFFAFAPDGRVAGLCRGFLGPSAPEGQQSTGLVDALGVVPEHRPTQLQRPLALTVIRWLRAQGQGALSLESFGGDEKTMQLYRDIGFAVDTHLLAFQLDLTAS